MLTDAVRDSCCRLSEGNDPPNGRRVWLIALSLSAVALVACNDADTRRRDAIANRLVGTWLEQVEQEELKFRRVLSLESGGTFQQAITVAAQDGSVRTEVVAGDWFFDGETLKRRYLTVNGKRVSGIQFASYQVISVTDTELACMDHLIEGKRSIKFQRVAGGTRP